MKHLIYEPWSGTWREQPAKPPFKVPIPKFLTIGKVQVPVIGTFDTGEVSFKGPVFLDIPIPEGEVWLTYSILYSYIDYVCLTIFDGTYESYCYSSQRIGGGVYVSSLMIPLKGGWSMRIKNSYTALYDARV
jgi:hypothetical protein